MTTQQTGSAGLKKKLKTGLTYLTGAMLICYAIMQLLMALFLIGILELSPSIISILYQWLDLYMALLLVGVWLLWLNIMDSPQKEQK